MLYQAASSPFDVASLLKFGELGLLTIVLIGMGVGIYKLLQPVLNSIAAACVAYLNEQVKIFVKLSEALVEMTRLLAAQSEQHDEMQRGVEKNNSILQAQARETERQTMTAANDRKELLAVAKETKTLIGNLVQLKGQK